MHHEGWLRQPFRMLLFRLEYDARDNISAQRAKNINNISKRNIIYNFTSLPPKKTPI